MIKKIKRLLEKKLSRLSPEEAFKILEQKEGEFHKIKKDWPGITFSDVENRGILFDIANNCIGVKTHEISLDGYREYLDTVKYKLRYPRYYPGNFTEKTLEHYVAFSLLKPALGRHAKFIDIAAERSPHSKIFARMTGCTGYRQDISYKPGVHGFKIGSNAADIPLPDNSFHAALAACSIEHFEDDADIFFMKEMCRILRPYGMVVVLPLYMHKKAFCVTDPAVSAQSDTVFDPGIDIHCVPGWNNRHGRYYSYETLRERLIMPNEEWMDFTVYYLKNFKQVDDSVYCRFALVGMKKEPPVDIEPVEEEPEEEEPSKDEYWSY